MFIKRPFHYKGQGLPKDIFFFSNFIGPKSAYHASGPLTLWFQRRRLLKSFYHIWALRPSWTNDPDMAKKCSSPWPMESPYDIWLWLAQWFLRRKPLKSVDNRRMTEPAYYKFTYEPKSWGELIKLQILPNIKGQGLLISDKKIFKMLPR